MAGKKKKLKAKFPQAFLPKQKRLNVMAFGTFDILHPGHLFYLNESRKLGNSLTVIVSTDSNSEKIKSKKPLNNENIRLGKIKNLRIVDKAILGSEKDMFEIVRKIKPDIIALGYDQKAEWLGEKLEKEKMKIGVVRIHPFEEKKYKSSIILGKIRNIPA